MVKVMLSLRPAWTTYKNDQNPTRFNFAVTLVILPAHQAWARSSAVQCFPDIHGLNSLLLVEKASTFLGHVSAMGYNHKPDAVSLGLARSSIMLLSTGLQMCCSANSGFQNSK